ncbi:relaxase/mobilization nuclease domain-containing protein [Thauera sp. SDU_THAU2]|uniref:relaxase/mobilization nuclease domain-containing protein n=1 Tax=Thauera sp. SDU_THAU2 TaxID=3136633 RepID=UPI00311DAE59
MILKGSQRGGARQLAAHLLNARDNEHVEVHALRGFCADDLHGAFQEIDATSRGTRAKQFLFSLSLNPPPREHVPTEAFEAAIESIERKLGLEGQPRAIVFHEKEGRRHAHVVWSRIDAGRMKAINLPHFKRKLQDVSRQLYREHGWAMPRGLADGRNRDPLNFTRAEWEQAKRAKQDPQALKAMFQRCWEQADSGEAYARALAKHGYSLAQGDRRAFVAVDFRGQVYAVAKWSNVKTKEVRTRLDTLKDVPGVEQAKAAIAARMTEALRGYSADAETARQKQRAALTMQRAQLVQRQRKERADLAAAQKQRQAKETALRASRLNRGMRGLWDRITGRHAKQSKANEHEALAAWKRDRQEQDALIVRQLDEREGFHLAARQQKQSHAQDMEQLHRDIAAYQQLRDNAPADLREHFRESARRARKRTPERDRGLSREP